jgi:hypothetical protein
LALERSLAVLELSCRRNAEQGERQDATGKDSSQRRAIEGERQYFTFRREARMPAATRASLVRASISASGPLFCVLYVSDMTALNGHVASESRSKTFVHRAAHDACSNQQ